MPEANTTTAAAATTTTAAATTTAATTTTTAANAPWHGYTAPEDVAYVTNKGWAGPQDAIKSYRGAEKLIGRDPNTLLEMPRADDPNGFLGVMDKLGRPADPTKYEFAKPEGASLDEGYLKWARGTFHKIGLTASQVKELSAGHNNYIKEVLTQREKDYNLTVESDKAALRAEWRDGHERKMLAAESAATALGFSKDMIDAIEQAVGYAGTWKFFADLGGKLGEDGFSSAGKGGKGPGFGHTLTPAEAKAEWEKLKVDPNWQAAAKDKMHPGNAEAKRKQDDLFKVMYPDG